MVRTKKEIKPVPELAAGDAKNAPLADSRVESTTTDETAEAPAVNGDAALTMNGDGTASGNDTATAAADTTTADTAEDAPAAESMEAEKKKTPTKSKNKKSAAKSAENAPAGGGEDNKENAEGEKVEGKKKKVVKKSIPGWATLSEEAKKKLVHSKAVKLARPKLEEEVVNAIKACADSKGNASAAAIRNYLVSNHPDLPKHLYKMAVKRAIDKHLIKQVKGTGFSGSFRVAPPSSSKAPASSKAGKKVVGGAGGSKAEKGSIEDVLPLVFTWVCNPKEASVAYIRKYIVNNYPDLDVEGAAFRKAIESGEAKRQLERISGKGFSGTFALVDGSPKTGAKYEDAIESAIIAMNEPKDASVTAIRDYMGVYHKEFDTDRRPLLLKKALERCEAKGWIVRITGKGFSGTFRLNYPYHPNPRELWGAEYKDKTEEKPKSTNKRKAVADESSDEEEAESSEDEEEVMPTPKKRGAPKPRASAAPPPRTAPKKKAAKKMAVAVKSKPVKKGRRK